MPPTEGLVASGAVAAANTVWAVGSVSFGKDAQPNLAVAKLDETTQRWIRGPVFEGLAGDDPAVEALTSLERDPIWTGTEVVVWGSAGGGLAYDTENETWRRIAAPIPPKGVLVDSASVMTNAGLTLIAQVDESGDPTVSIATSMDGAWVWSDAADLPISGIDRVKVASAGNWLVLLHPDGAPIVVNAATGSWSVSANGPLAGLKGASAVWTPPTVSIGAGGDPAAASDMVHSGRCEDASHVVTTFRAPHPNGIGLGASSMVLSRDPGLESWYVISARVVGGP